MQTVFVLHVESSSLMKLEGKNILIEGARNHVFDIDHGTYPFVTYF